MTFTPNRPTATEFLQVSQGLINANFTSSDNTFGIEHYKFSDVTANKGFHNTVTQPLIIGAAHPTTTINPIIYTMSTNGTGPQTLQFSRGVNDAVPTPITNVHSGTSPLTLPAKVGIINGSLNIFDFAAISGITIAMLYFANIDNIDPANASCIISWNSAGSLIKVTNIVATNNSGIAFNNSGTLLVAANVSPNVYANVYWTIQFERMGP